MSHFSPPTLFPSVSASVSEDSSDVSDLDFIKLSENKILYGNNFYKEIFEDGPNPIVKIRYMPFESLDRFNELREKYLESISKKDKKPLLNIKLKTDKPSVAERSLNSESQSDKKLRERIEELKRKGGV